LEILYDGKKEAYIAWIAERIGAIPPPPMEKILALLP